MTISNSTQKHHRRLLIQPTRPLFAFLVTSFGRPCSLALPPILAVMAIRGKSRPRPSADEGGKEGRKVPLWIWSVYLTARWRRQRPGPRQSKSNVNHAVGAHKPTKRTQTAGWEGGGDHMSRREASQFPITHTERERIGV